MCLIRYKMDRMYRNVLCEVDPGTIKEDVWFLEPMVKVNRVGKKQERTVVITDLALYNFKSKSFSGFQRRISLHDLARLLVSDGTLDVVVQPIETLAEYDYHFVPQSLEQRDRFVTVIQHVFYKLLGESLVVVSRPLADVSKLIMTKAALRTRSLRRDSDVVMTRRARARASMESGYQAYTRPVPVAVTMPAPLLTSPPPLPSSPPPVASIEGGFVSKAIMISLHCGRYVDVCGQNRRTLLQCCQHKFCRLPLLLHCLPTPHLAHVMFTVFLVHLMRSYLRSRLHSQATRPTACWRRFALGIVKRRRTVCD